MFNCELEYSGPESENGSELDLHPEPKSEPVHSWSASLLNDFILSQKVSLSTLLLQAPLTSGAVTLTNGEKMKALIDHLKPTKDYHSHCDLSMENRVFFFFRYVWLEEYKWLVYSPSHNDAFCKILVMLS